MRCSSRQRQGRRTKGKRGRRSRTVKSAERLYTTGRGVGNRSYIYKLRLQELSLYLVLKGRCLITKLLLNS